MACAYLRQQKTTGGLHEDLLGEDVDDLAMDAIAGLFERDEQGRFPELHRYFADRDLNGMSAADAEAVLRRLVMGAVTDGLFEAYRAADRSLSNLIHNLKRVLDDRPHVELRRRGQTLWVEGRPGADSRAGEAAGREPGRAMPMDTLEAHLTGTVEDDPTTGELLDEAIETLRAHPTYRAAYPLTRLAQVMRAARVRVQAVTDHAAPVSQPDAPLLRNGEIEEAIVESLREMREEKRSTYVASGKVEEDTYAAYFRALHDRLVDRFVTPGDERMTHYEVLSNHVADLSRAEYRTQHRSRFEYLEQCAREVLADRLREVV